MMFWLLATGMVALVAFFLLRALASGRNASDSRAVNLAFFEAQEREIERQQSAGLMSADDGRVARSEAARRLISISKAGAPAEADLGAPGTKQSLMVIIIVALAMPLAAIPLYLSLGAPNLPARPYETRDDLDRSAVELARLIGRLDAHLAEKGDDARGWELAYPVYMRLGRFESAVQAANRIIELKGSTAELQASLAEAHISLADGKVDSDARVAIDKALKLDPKLPRARFFAGMSADQGGDPELALAIWSNLIAELPDGPEKSAVSIQIERLNFARTSPGASSIQSLSPQEQALAIRGMVDGLAERLKAGGGTVAEWQRLVRALIVLGEKDRATKALNDARTALKDETGASVTLDRLAQELAGAQ